MPLQHGGMLHTRLLRLAHYAYGLAAALAAVTLWGWVLDVPRLRDFGAYFHPTPPAVALAFILLAGGFFAAHRARGLSRAAVLACAAAGLLAVLSLVEALGGVALGMRFAFFGAWHRHVPDVMSPAAAMAVLLLALVTPLPREPR